jgi:N-acetylglucosamine malate deacetylase 1
MNRFIARLWQSRVSQFGHCPVPALLDIPSSGNILVIAPHPDDEVLGCGGTIALLADAGCEVRVVVVTDGAAGDPSNFVSNVVQVRQSESIAALAILGVTRVEFLGEADGRFSGGKRFDEKIARILTDYQADWIFMPPPLDYHRDHVAISVAVMNVWNKLGGNGRVFFYETWAPLPATHVVAIGSTLEKKQLAISCYQLPLRYCNYLEAITGLAVFRGLYLKSDGRPAYAEAFLEEGPHSLWQLLLRLRYGLEMCLNSTTTDHE